MDENKLKKEFSKRDVQRMRNIITGNAGSVTGVQSGYTKQQTDYQENDIWEENGKQWTIKNGLKQTVTKFDKMKRLVVLPLTCPCCKSPMKLNDLNKKMWSIHNKCFECVVEMEAKIKREGKWDEYEKQMLNNNKNTIVDDFEISIEEFLKTKHDS